MFPPPFLVGRAAPRSSVRGRAPAAPPMGPGLRTGVHDLETWRYGVGQGLAAFSRGGCRGRSPVGELALHSPPHGAPHPHSRPHRPITRLPSLVRSASVSPVIACSCSGRRPAYAIWSGAGCAAGSEAWRGLESRRSSAGAGLEDAPRHRRRFDRRGRRPAAPSPSELGGGASRRARWRGSSATPEQRGEKYQKGRRSPWAVGARRASQYGAYPAAPGRAAPWAARPRGAASNTSRRS